MDTSSFSFSLVLLILNIFKLTSSTTLFNSTNIDQDSLLSFKNGVVSDPYSVLSSNWLTNTSMCNWTGVSCSLKHHRVTALNLSGYELRGNLAPHLGNLTFLQSLDVSHNFFTGSVPSELSNLRRLKEFNVSFNNLTGEIPSWLGGLPRIQRILMRDNDFSGSIPSGVFTNMSSLVEIDLINNMLLGQLPNDTCRDTPQLRRICLTGNQIAGRIPVSFYKCRMLEDLFLGMNKFIGDIPSEIGNMTMLRKLLMYSNVLEGKIPPSIFNMSSIEYLDLNDNLLSGNLPAFNNLSKIEYLDLSLNNFSGAIPEEIGHLTSLTTLTLFNNNFSGNIPKQLGNLTALGVLDLSGNKLAGELPEELGNLVYLEEFDVSYNDLLYGHIPSSMFNISTLRRLSLQQNQFSGSLPPNMGLSLPNLEGVFLYWNQFSGQIPSSINNASKLTMLELNNNSFTGSIPDFGNLVLLQSLRLWENNLTGAESPGQELRFLCSLTNCRYLVYLEVSDNPMMNGVLPPCIGNLSSSLVTFAASNCNIRGVIPSELGSLSSLQRLDLSKNQIEGFIPTTIRNLKELGLLYLHDNKLQGFIPNDLCQMSSLSNLNLSVNMLTGSIPECFGEIRTLREVSLASNNLNSTVPSSFFNLEDLINLDLSSNNFSGEISSDIGRLKVINWLSLSSNSFCGSIPDRIEGCESLETLILSKNMLNGSIPQSLGKVMGLKKLDLSNNNLSGSIPTSLEKLKLKQLNASYNELEGEIPSGGCFVNFTIDSFLSNAGLCGATRFGVRPCRRNPGRSTWSKVVQAMKYALPVFVAVMIIVVCVILHIRRRRPKNVPPKLDITSVGVSWKRYSEIELKKGTNSFSETNLLGRGGMGSVFRAKLAEGDIAVKVFDLQLEGATKSFETECGILSAIRHRNLVKILGCCSNPEFKALTLAYMPNGSLEKWLHSDKYCMDLDLVSRLYIALDVALALEYLHHDHAFTVVHCDIKPNNVLLDAEMTAHVGDFGISKLLDDGDAAAHTRNMATIGYAAPEFGSEGKISTSGDVYSYGILLMEMFTSKKPTDDMFSAEMSIKEWVEKALQENEITKIVAPGLLSTEDPHFSAKLECLISIFELAMKCVAFSPLERNDMKQAVVSLHKIKAKVPMEEVKKKNNDESK